TILPDELAIAGEFLLLVLVTREHLDDDLPLRAQRCDRLAKTGLVSPRRADRGPGRRRRREFGKRTQLQGKAGGRARAAKGLTHPIVATTTGDRGARGDRTGSIEGIGGKADAAVVMVARQVGQIDGEFHAVEPLPER